MQYRKGGTKGSGNKMFNTVQTHQSSLLNVNHLMPTSSLPRDATRSLNESRDAEANVSIAFTLHAVVFIFVSVIPTICQVVTGREGRIKHNGHEPNMAGY